MSDKQIENQIIDSTSFRQLLGIHTVDEIPDEKTIWNVRNFLSKAGTFDALFDRVRSYLDSKGLSFYEGKIIDASFVEAPRQRNTRAKAAIALTCLVYNIFRYVQINKYQPQLIASMVIIVSLYRPCTSVALSGCVTRSVNNSLS